MYPGQPDWEPQPTGPPRRQSTVLIGVWLLAAVLAGVLVVVAFISGSDDGSDEDPAASGPDDQDDGDEAGEPTTTAYEPPVALDRLLLTQEDLPPGWTESDVRGAPGDELICGEPVPEPEPGDPASSATTSFETLAGDVLVHTVTESSPDSANAFFEALAQSEGACESWPYEGPGFQGTATADLLNGPTFGDETLWYELAVTFTDGSTLERLSCLDRRGGLLSSVTVSRPGTASPDDRELLETLAEIVAERTG